MRIFDPKKQCPVPDQLPELDVGAKGKDVRLLQEWLQLSGFGTAIDGEFGPATAAAVARFSRLPVGPGSIMLPGMPERGSKVTKRLWGSLVSPMTSALNLDAVQTKDLRQAVVFCAGAFLKAQAREVGGENRGPWVRLFMDGNEGDPWAWCAGFATFVLRMAEAATGVTPELRVTRSYRCDAMGQEASGRGTLLHGGTRPAGLQRGDIFLVGTPSHYQHTGVVIEVAADHLVTIEGNSNNNGSREGYSVVRHIRSYASLDFISLGL